ncbi:capsid cement protein [Comamonas sp.]|uniref:capsid cement protein n=1 Tax=Comamonas sp. TaxID=34028 RepID=UPI003A8FD26F
MANNYIQPGKVLDYVNTTATAVASGQVVLVGVILGVALVNIAPGQTGSVQIEGVFAVPKLAGAAIAQGAVPVFKVAEQAFAGGAAVAGDVSGACAVAFAAAETGAMQVLIKFTGVPGTVKA